MHAKSIVSIFGIGIVFAANVLLAQDTNKNTENLSKEELEIIENSKQIDQAIEKQADENGDFSPAPDSDILPPSIEMDTSNNPIPNLSLDNPNSAAIFPSNENVGSEEDNKIIIGTPHRKREIDPIKQADLVELSRIIGSLHALRTACNGASDQTYRSKMTSLLDLEAPASTYIREPLIAAFNFGFRDQGSGNGNCESDKNAAKEANLAKIGRKYALKLAATYDPSLRISNKD